MLTKNDFKFIWEAVEPSSIKLGKHTCNYGDWTTDGIMYRCLIPNLACLTITKPQVSAGQDWHYFCDFIDNCHINGPVESLDLGTAICQEQFIDWFYEEGEWRPDVDYL